MEIDATLEIISLKCIHEIQVIKAEDKVLNQRPHSQAETGKDRVGPPVSRLLVLPYLHCSTSRFLPPKRFHTDYCSHRVLE